MAATMCCSKLNIFGEGTMLGVPKLDCPSWIALLLQDNAKERAVYF
jgi:hypothetical protein